MIKVLILLLIAGLAGAISYFLLKRKKKWDPKRADSWAITSNSTFYIEKIYSKPPKKGHFFRCPHCLEDLQDPGTAPEYVLRACPICQRSLQRELCQKPLHEFNKCEQFDLLYEELCTLTGALDGLNRGYKRHYGRDSDLNDDEIRLGKMIGARDHLKAQRNEISAKTQSLEEAFMVGLLGYPGGDGGLSYQFESGRLLRQKAWELSKNGAGPEKIIPFQLDLINATSHGAYDSSERRREVLKTLEIRLANSEKTDQPKIKA
jgi:hypothetical protein